jgi:hypothetical protein
MEHRENGGLNLTSIAQQEWFHRCLGKVSVLTDCHASFIYAL